MMIGFRCTFLFVTLLGGIAPAADATYPIVDCRPNCWGKEGLEIQAALAIEDPEESKAAAREAVRKGLFSDRQSRKNVITFLSTQRRWVPVEDYADILIEAHDAGLADGRGVLDYALLLRSPREYRIAIYGEAISNGTVTLAYGTSMPAYSAIGLAAVEGLSELQPLVEANIELVGTEAEYYLEMLALTSGGVDREDAAAKAVARLQAMPPHQLYDKMEKNSSFRRAVLQIVDFSCVEGNDPRCLDLLEVSQKQQALLAAAQKAGQEIMVSDPVTWRFHLHETTLKAASYLRAKELERILAESQTSNK
jgi:hypothetical protein